MKKINSILFSLLLLSSLGCKNNNFSSSSESSINSNISSSEVYFNPYDYIKYVSFLDLQESINNKEDFLYIIASSNCGWCAKQFNEIYDYMHLLPTEIQIHYLDDLYINLEKDLNGDPIKGEESFNKAKEEYRFFASRIEKIYDFQSGEEGSYIEKNYTERFGEREPALVYPTTFIFIDGELVKEFSYVGYGWTKDEASFKSFINIFNSLKKD